MNRAFLVSITAAFLVTPLALAHDPAGTPKNYCEPMSDWIIHDYAPLASGQFNFAPMDGNVLGDCNGSTVLKPGVACVGVGPADPVNSFFVGFCEQVIDPPFADWDGHADFGQGGAYILAGPVAEDCWGARAHHVEFGPVTVNDLVLGTGVSFTVASDVVDFSGGSGCGDNLSDIATDCVGTCTVNFPSGLDGSYQVYVTGTMGHITW